MAASAAILFVIIGKGTIMATAPQSGQPIQLGSGNQLQAIAQLLPTLFGSTQTASGNPGDTTALQQLITQLQGADYNKTLETIFQQAGGQIPGLQAAFSNAVGARSGSNSAVQAALSKLMMETTLAGQKQVADQQLNNQQIQASAGNSIAQATKNTTQTQKQSGVMPQLTALLGLVQAAKMATGSKDIDELGRKFGLGGSAGRDAGAVPVTGPVPMAGGPVAGDAFMPGAMSSGGAITSTDNTAFLDALAPFLSGGVPGDANMPAELGAGGANMPAAPIDWGPGQVIGDAYQPGFDFNTGGGGLGPEFDQYLDYGFGGGVDEFNF